MLDLLFRSIWPNSSCFCLSVLTWRKIHCYSEKQISTVTCFVPVLKNQWAKTCKLVSCTCSLLLFHVQSGFFLDCPRQLYFARQICSLLYLMNSCHSTTLHIQNCYIAHVQVFLPGRVYIYSGKQKEMIACDSIFSISLH